MPALDSSTTAQATSNQPGINEYWLPFSANAYFKNDPFVITEAHGMYCKDQHGNTLLDMASGLWCTNTGHTHPKIVEAVRHQIGKLDYALAFNASSDLALQAAAAVTELTPANLGHVFFTNSGSEAVDTALKIALGYHWRCGQPERNLLVGRVGGYHGIGWGGVSVSGTSAYRKHYPTLPAAHIPTTLDFERNSFSRGQPAWGHELASLKAIEEIYGAERIAVVIVEPVAGSGGVLPPPEGYLQTLRKECDRVGALLILDEVITGFGRIGTGFAAERFDIKPDLLTMAKGLTAGHVPMGAVAVSNDIYDAYITETKSTAPEFPHGYTYSGHPLASAAAVATIDVYAEEDLFARCRELESYFEDSVHSLKDIPNVRDIRNMGLMAAIDIDPEAGLPSNLEIFRACAKEGVIVRNGGVSSICLSPALIVEKSQIDTCIEVLRTVLERANRL